LEVGAVTGGDGLSLGGGSLRGTGLGFGFGSTSELLRSEPELPSVVSKKHINQMQTKGIKIRLLVTRIFESDTILTVWIWRVRKIRNLHKHNK
jgi:hypothetical protein